MMRYKFFAALMVFFLLSFNASGQNIEKKELSLKDAILKRFTDYYPEYISGLQWRAKSNQLVKKAEDKKSLLVSKNLGETWDTLVKVDYLNRKGGLELNSMPRIKWFDRDKFGFRHGKDYFIFNLNTGELNKLTRYPVNGQNTDICYKTGNIAYTIDNNLYIKKANGDCISVTDFDDKNIVAGQSIARNEFGIEKGTFWSPQGNYLAFYQKDESDVTDYPLVDITKRVAEYTPIKYPMAGMNSEYPAVGIYDIASGKTVYLDTDNGEKDHYLTNLVWDPNEKYVYLAEINRAQNHMWYNKYDVKTGERVKTLFEEQNDKYVEPVDAAWFLPEKENQFLWFSRRDGFKHLYRYDTDGNFLGQVTKGNFPMHRILGTDKSGKYIFVTGAGDTGLNEYLYKANLNNGKTVRLSKHDGVHRYIMQDDANYFIDIYSTVHTPHVTQIVDAKGNTVNVLLKSADPLKDIKTGTTQLLDITAADGKTVLHARMIKPYDFDPSKKYKVLVYVYGGPHVQLVRNAWMAYAPLWMHYLANKGYIIFTLDNRGSDNRGFAFESVIHRHLGKNEIEDQMKGVEYLKSLPFVDTSKIAVHGWSFGGFMTTSLMLRKPGVFKAGVAGGPVINWEYYEVMYGERYMDTPQENPEGYKESNLLNYADKLQGNLMLVIGSVDPVVVPQHSMQMLKHFIEAEKQVDFFTYPMHPHNVRGRDRVHLMRKVLDYIDDKLEKTD